MQRCTACGHEEIEGVRFCSDCGTELLSNIPLQDALVQQEVKQEPSAPEALQQVVVTQPDNNQEATIGQQIGEKSELVLVFIQNGAETNIQINVKGTVSFGKFSPDIGPVDIDFENFNFPNTQYVSRKHALIIRQNNSGNTSWFLKDLGSLNGTWLNGKRINPNEEILLTVGDMVNFANLKFVVR